MARMPDAEWLGEHGSVPMTESSLNKICIHTIAGRYPAHAAHLSIRGDGHKGQSRDTRFRSEANYYGNDDVIAIECEDTGPNFPVWDHNDGHAVPGFTILQINSIAECIVWGWKTHAIPLVECPDSKDGSSGIAYHRQGIDGNFASAGYAYGGREPGGEQWSKSFGKACPGDRRITQLKTEIIPLALVLAFGEVNEVANASNVRLMRGDQNTATYAVKLDPTLKTQEGEPTAALRCYVPGPIGPALIEAFGPVVMVTQASFDAIAKVEGSA